MSRLKDYLGEVTVVKPEQMNWKKINPKLDIAIRNVVDVGNLVTKDSKQYKGLHSILNSLKAIQADLRHMK